MSALYSENKRRVARITSGRSNSLIAHGGGYLELPYNYNMSGVAESSGGVAAQLDDWTVFSDRSDAEITTSVADSNSYTPSGVTKGFIVAWDATRDGIVWQLPKVIAPNLTSIRVAFLFKTAEVAHGCSFWLNNLVTIAGDSLLSMYPQIGSTPDKFTSTEIYGSGDTYHAMNFYSGGGNAITNRYHWVRAEWNLVTKNVYAHVVRAEDSSVIDDLYRPIIPEVKYIPPNIEYMMFSPQGGGTTATIVRFWIGTASHTWPT